MKYVEIMKKYERVMKKYDATCGKSKGIDRNIWKI